MFDIMKIGNALSTLRKKADMTQNEVADKLNLSRQAISKYERGESFPDISVLIMLAELYNVTLDQLISYGEPTEGESSILKSIAKGNEDIVADDIADVVNLAPLLKPSVLTKMSRNFEKQGIDISDIVILAEYLNDDAVLKLIENSTFDEISDELMKKFIPMLNSQSKEAILRKILDGETDWHFIEVLLPYADYFTSQIEAAVMEGALPRETLDILNHYYLYRNGYSIQSIALKSGGKMQHYYLCPECKSETTLPVCNFCGYKIPFTNSIYRFCSDDSVKLEGDNKYIGYDGIGEDFEPEVTYWDANNTDRYGVYAACGDLIAKTFGTDISVLDLGAGLGTASIPLAKNGIYTIAADISAVMLGTAVKRARGRYENLVAAQMNAYELMLPDNSIDIVVENAMLHLVDKPEIIIKEICRVLKPGGKLIRYSSPSLPISKEEAEQNIYCNQVISDISDFYYKYLEEHNYQSTVFNIDYRDVLMEYFNVPYSKTADGFAEVFTDKMKFRLHRMKTGAHSDLQGTPKELIDAAWAATDQYARGKYGNDYAEIKGFSKYGASIDIYTVK